MEGRSTGRRVTMREAADELGVSVEAIRKRVQRGSIRSDKDPDGRRYVYLDEGVDAYHPQAEVESSELVEELRRQNEYLRGQLDIRTEELREHRRLLAGLIERVPELEAPREQSRATEEPEASDTDEEEPERAEPWSAGAGTPGPQEGVQRRSWWRRMFIR